MARRVAKEDHAFGEPQTARQGFDLVALRAAAGDREPRRPPRIEPREDAHQSRDVLFRPQRRDGSDDHLARIAHEKRRVIAGRGESVGVDAVRDIAQPCRRQMPFALRDALKVA